MSKLLKKGRFHKILTWGLYTLPLAAVAGAFGAYSLVKDLPNPERISERDVIQSTKIYDRTGEILLYEIHGDIKRTSVPLEEIPDYAVRATLAAEDIHFYKHFGLDFQGILRALAKNLARGRITQGGSTITQQLIKNSLLGSPPPKPGLAKSLLRKLKEQVLAVVLERNYSKDEILGFYLNQIPYGSNAYGVSAASDLYFSKKVGELTLAEAATLAALPRAPTYYSPYGSNLDKLVERKNWILERMLEEGWASEEEVSAAKTEKLNFSLVRGAIRAPHFVFFVREELNGIYGEEFVERGGLKVITTLDWELQQAAEKAVREGAERNKNLVEAHNASLVAINPKTGEILAMVGSREWGAEPEPQGCTPGLNCKFDPQVNVALRERQPGSAFKPFVYATAFKKGYTPETVLFDVQTEFNPLCNPDGTPGPLISDPKDCYHPGNYDDRFRGPVTLRQAIAQSLNVPSVKLLYLAGVKDSIETAQNLGLTTLKDPGRYGLSLVLGGAEVKLLELTSALGAFSQEGVLHPKRAILRVENSQGAVLEETKDTARVAVDSEVARTINSLLSDNDARVPVFSPQSSLYFRDRQVAAKTGTTQDYRDAWVIGYTPSIAAGVWVGNNDNSPMNQKGLSIMVAGPIWRQFLENFFARTPPEEFTPPEKETPEKPALRGIYRTGPVVQIDKTTGGLASLYTPPELVAEAAFGEVKPLLYFIEKESPAGPAPQNPEEDPQYKNWEISIKNWLGENPLPQPSFPVIPETAPYSLPKIEFISPPENAAFLPEGPESITVGVERKFPLKEVQLFVDEVLVNSRTAPIVEEKITFFLGSKLAAGSHTIKITAYDAVGNRVSREKEITVLR